MNKFEVYYFSNFLAEWKAKETREATKSRFDRFRVDEDFVHIEILEKEKIEIEINTNDANAGEEGYSREEIMKGLLEISNVGHSSKREGRKYQEIIKAYFSHKDNNPFKIFILDDTSENLMKLQQKYGFYFFNVDTLLEKWDFVIGESSEKLYEPVIFNGDYDEDWSKVFKINEHPFNSITITDPYSFSNRAALKESLKAIQELMNKMPKLEKLFITLIYFDSDKYIRQGRKLTQIRETNLRQQCQQNIINRVNAFYNLKNQRNIEIRAIEIHKDFNHNRKIYTNYFTLSCETSFNGFFKLSQPHTIQFLSMLECKVSQVYDKYNQQLSSDCTVEGEIEINGHSPFLEYYRQQNNQQND